MTIKSPVTIYRKIYWVLLLLAVSTVGEISAAEPDEPIKLTLHPATEPIPALKYRLLPKFIDRKSGNAAVFYGKVTAEQIYFFSSKEWRKKIHRWPTTPLKELLLEEARVPLNPRFLRQAALCQSCDWQLPIREGLYFGMLLPEVQQTRAFARILASQARIQIAHGEFEQAIESFQNGFALGRNVATGEAFVSGVVGVTISAEMLKQVTEFVQQPDAPNLYWAITMLPRPFIGMRDALEAEMSAFDLSYPELRDLETKHRSPKEWQEVLHSFSEYYALFSDQEDNPLRIAGIYLNMLKNYPSAKQLLIKQGVAAKRVESMSKEQVVALSALHVAKRQQQDVNKYFHLPYPAAIKGMASAIERAESKQNEFTRTFEGSPVPIRVRKVIARNTRRFEVLRILEALRIHAAAHDGKLPTHLSDIAVVPIPLDPVTGKSFEYQLQGKTATLRGPVILDSPLNYEITMKPQSN